jgi:hypothetical protein
MLEVFKELTVSGDPQTLSKLVDEITEHPATGWRRNRDREPRNMPKLSAGHEIAVFRWEGPGVVPIADMFLKGSGQIMKVTNIVPVETPKLSFSEYNGIIDDFASRNVAPLREQLRLNVQISPDHLPITHWLKEETANLLSSFSHTANRSIPHPLDTERWRAFLIKAHLEHTTLDTETLFRWLTEEERWPEEEAERLILQFEFALQLLDDYDKQ